MADSFLEILRKARQKDVQQSVEEIQEVVQENVDELKKIDKNEEVDYIYLGDLIIETSKKALLNSKKLKAINSARRLCKRICSGNIKMSDVEKCFKMQERFTNSKNINYQLVGGDAMNKLEQLLYSGVQMNDALNTKIER